MIHVPECSGDSQDTEVTYIWGKGISSLKVPAGRGYVIYPGLPPPLK